MESVYPELAHCVSKHKCARTNTVFFPISEISEGTVSLIKFLFILADVCQNIVVFVLVLKMVFK